MEENNCPKPDCGRPESSRRNSAGKQLSICGNGHSWDAVEVAEQRAKAKRADHFEIKIETRSGSEEAVREFERRYRGGIFKPRDFYPPGE